MTKDELKNRISMALKDPILQQGFEIICKDLAELEQKNAELKEKLTKAKELLRMVIDSYNHKERFSFEKDLMKAEQFLKEVEE